MKKLLVLTLIICLVPTILTAGSETGLFSKGRELANKGDYEGALQYFMEAVAVSPDYVPAYIAMAVVYVNMKRNYEAIDTLEKVILLDEDNANAHYIIAMLYEEVGNAYDAIAAWKRFLELSPRGGRANIAGEHLKRLERN